MEKRKYISCGNGERLLQVAVALSTPTRIDILRRLRQNSMSVKELAFQLNLPLSTVSANIKVLEEADLVRSSYQSGKHGSMKLCSIKYEEIIMQLMVEQPSVERESYDVSMPIGNYFDCNIAPTCGLADENNFIGKDDDVRTFYSPKRLQAQLIWFMSGWLEYRFPIDVDVNDIVSVSFSLECCSEAPGFRNKFPSDVTFWVNDNEICEWTSPGDFGGIRGTYTPAWWPISSTQYGIRKKISIRSSGSYLDDEYVNAINLMEINLGRQPYVSFKVGIKSTARNVGGINIFGDKFGNYPQSIVMHVEHLKKK